MKGARARECRSRELVRIYIGEDSLARYEAMNYL